MPEGKIELHTDVLSTWDALSDAEWGRLVKAMLAYRLTGQTEQLLGAERIMFSGERMKIDKQLAEEQSHMREEEERLAKEEEKRKKTRERVTRYRSRVTQCNALHSVTERYTALHSPSPSPPSPEPPTTSPTTPTTPLQKETPPTGGKRKRFSPPTAEEVSQYCRERNNGVDAVAFVDFYASKGWVVGRSPMKDWKAAVRTWERRDGCGPKLKEESGPRRYHLEMVDGEEVLVYDD